MYTPTITVCTDAGHSIPYKFGYWACYIRTPDRTIKHSGILKEPVSGSAEAEKKGLANALHILTSLYDVSQYRLIIYCDNKTILQPPTIKKTPASAYYAPSVAARDWWFTHIGNVVAQAAGYEFRHVKGHLAKKKWDKTSKRNYMNDFCDKECQRIGKAEAKRRRQLLMDEKRQNKDEEWLLWITQRTKEKST